MARTATGAHTLTARENALVYLGMYAAEQFPKIDVLEAVREFVASIDEIKQGKRSRFLGLPDDPTELEAEFDAFINKNVEKYLI